MSALLYFHVHQLRDLGNTAVQHLAYARAAEYDTRHSVLPFFLSHEVCSTVLDANIIGLLSVFGVHCTLSLLQCSTQSNYPERWRERAMEGSTPRERTEGGWMGKGGRAIGHRERERPRASERPREKEGGASQRRGY